ncbi:1633_t:CDS:2, partial [Racocetra persica]
IEKAKEIFDLKNIQYLYKNRTVQETSELALITYLLVDFNDNIFKKVFDSNKLSLDTNTLKIAKE